MNKVIQIDLKLVIILLVGVVVISGTVGAFASNLLSSNEVTYCPDTNNMQAATVEDALDLLYARVDNVPIGTIMPYMGTTAPENYLICDGSTYNIADYKALADHIKADFGSYNKFGGDGTTTFKVPDLRGEFLRGAGTATRDTGSGAAVGNHQDATILQNWYSTGTNGNIEIWNDAASFSIQNEDKRLSTSTVWQNLNATRSTNHDSRPNKSTTRPTNTSVNYLIKAN